MGPTRVDLPVSREYEINTEEEELPMDPKLTEVTAWMKGEIKNAKDSIKEFAKSLLENPAAALEWSQSEFETAATIQVLGGLVEAIEDKDSKVTVESLRDYVLDEALRKAANGSSSTSPPSNFMKQTIAARWARLHDQLKYRLP